MKTAIIAAMKEEIAPFISYYGQGTLVFQRGKTYIYKISETLYLVESGIGKANAAATSAWLFEKVPDLDLVINTGSTGSFKTDFGLGDVIISSKAIYSDVDATGFDYKWGQVPQMPADYPVDGELLENVLKIVSEKNFDFSVHTGIIVTSDSFMSSKERVNEIKRLMGDIAASDMENAAIIQIAQQYNVKWLNIRGISDYVGIDAANTFDATLDKAAQNAFETVVSLVDSFC